MGGEYDFDLPSMSDDSWSDTGSWSDSQVESGSTGSAYGFDKGGESNYTLGKTDADLGYNFGTDASTLGTDYKGNNFKFNDESWYVNSEGTDPSMFNDLWTWAKTDQGVSVAGGVANAAFKTWQMQRAEELAEKRRREDLAARGRPEAELRDARIKAHNASINTPMNINMTKLQRP